MNMVRVKICGITRKEDLDVAAAAGADAVGFVVGAPASPRNLSLETAAKLLRQVPPFVKSVIVSLSASVDVLVETCSDLNPDVVQLHGESLRNAEYVREELSNMTLIGAVNANLPSALETALAASKIFDGILLDSLSQGQYGGTGIVHDWTSSIRIKQAIHPAPLILAGGLNPANVAEAVRVVHPYAVDVSSGVEQQPGVKDHQKMVDFVKNAKDV
jgi:phosphoribosylanthranilate isomerase